MNANNKLKPTENQAFKVSQSPLFEMGRVVASPGALALLDQQGVQPTTLIHRHVHGDWCGMEADDWQANIDAVKSGCRVFSSFCVNGRKLWVITEAEDDSGSRSSTCILLPSEY